MGNTRDIEQRLTDLEIKASYTEDLLEQLDQVIVRQQQQIELLLREIGHHRALGGHTGPAAPRDPRDELPPHY